MLSYFSSVLSKVYSRHEVGIVYRRCLEVLCGVAPNDCYFFDAASLTELQRERMQQAADRLAVNEPLEYVLEQAEFLGLSLKVSPAVLIPRPETQELVDIVRQRHGKRVGGLRAMDLCCGSGCIAVSLAKFLPECDVDALDISAAALEIAAENAKANGVNVNTVQFDLLSSDYSRFAPDSYDIVCCNPPYVRECEKPEMAANVLDYEPWQALFVSNENPLVFYKAAADFCGCCLKKGGSAYFELNRYTADDCGKLFCKSGFDTEIMHDLSGAKRFLIALK